MDKKLEEILKNVETGEMDIISALAELGAMNYSENIGFACIDRRRNERCGFPEFIYGKGKTAGQIAEIIRKMRDAHPVLATRVSENKAMAVMKKVSGLEYDSSCGCLMLREKMPATGRGKILILTAGTSDLPAAREAEYTAEFCGCGTDLVTDAGVAGIHRLFAQSSKLRKADVIIAAAGMEGALPSVVGGLVSCPVIALPTSVGYGASLNGFTPLLAMLNSCASGITVVNIDNGFGAACAAVRIINILYGKTE
jgi:hypothetical protein